ncbi:18148_t:CDS:2, partial [Cetraspora pellucida]
FSLVYSLSGTPTVPQNGTVDYCGSSSFVGYHNYNLPRDRYCFIVVNPNDVPEQMLLVPVLDKSAYSPKKPIFARDFRRRGFTEIPHNKIADSR